MDVKHALSRGQRDRHVALFLAKISRLDIIISRTQIRRHVGRKLRSGLIRQDYCDITPKPVTFFFITNILCVFSLEMSLTFVKLVSD